jgi:hypothetical protein
MQYRNATHGHGAPPADGEGGSADGFDEEIDLGVDPSSGEDGAPADGADALPEEMTIAVPAALDSVLSFASIVAGSLNLA